MARQEFIDELKSVDYIFGRMYGDINNKIIKIKNFNIIDNLGVVDQWGYPHDFIIYKFEDYGKTWAFTKEELIDQSIEHTYKKIVAELLDWVESEHYGAGYDVCDHLTRCYGVNMNSIWKTKYNTDYDEI